jgi:hypothetical protein
MQPQHYPAGRLGRKAFRRVPDSRIRYLAGRIHSVGPRALAELLTELDAGVDLQDALERYARLDHYRDFIIANRGDQLTRLRVIGGGR